MSVKKQSVSNDSVSLRTDENCLVCKKPDGDFRFYCLLNGGNNNPTIKKNRSSAFRVSATDVGNGY